MFSERIIVGISQYEDTKNILECPSDLVPNLESLGYE